MSEVVIVGAGPAGLTIASRTEALVLEARRKPGRPPHCTGFVSIDTALLLPREAWSQVYDELIVCSGLKGPCINLHYKFVRVDRPLLEDILAAEAEAQGSRIMLGVRGELHQGKIYACRRGSCKSLDDARVVFIAEGAAWRLARSLRLAPRGYTLYAYQVLCKCGRRVDAPIAMLGGRRVKYAWIVPLHDSRVLVGAAGRAGLVHRFVEALIVKLGCRREGERRGLIPYTLPSPKPCRRLGSVTYCVAGDAAGLVKATSGGGLYAITRLAPSYALVAESRGTDIEELLREYRRVERVLFKHYLAARLYYDMGVLRLPFNVIARLLASVRLAEYDELKVEAFERRAPLETHSVGSTGRGCCKEDMEAHRHHRRYRGDKEAFRP